MTKRGNSSKAVVEYCIESCHPRCDSCDNNKDNCTSCASHETRESGAPTPYCNCAKGYYDYKWDDIK